MQWYDGLFELDADSAISADDWVQIFAVREAVSKQLEQVRTDGKIGAALTAEIDLYCGDAASAALAKLDDELRFVFITSAARLHALADKSDEAVEVAADVFVAVRAANVDKKCTRCWHHVDDVGSHAEHPELCGRCVSNVTGEGESRQYA